MGGDVPADSKQMAKDYAEYIVKNLIDDEDDKWIMDYLLTVKGSKGYAYRTAAFFKVYNDNKKNGVGKLCNGGDLDKDGYCKPVKSILMDTQVKKDFSPVYLSR